MITRESRLSPYPLLVCVIQVANYLKITVFLHIFYLLEIPRPDKIKDGRVCFAFQEINMINIRKIYMIFLRSLLMMMLKKVHAI